MAAKLSPKMQDALTKIRANGGRVGQALNPYAALGVNGHSVNALVRRGLLESRSEDGFAWLYITAAGIKVWESLTGNVAETATVATEEDTRETPAPPAECEDVTVPASDDTALIGVLDVPPYEGRTVRVTETGRTGCVKLSFYGNNPNAGKFEIKMDDTNDYELHAFTAVKLVQHATSANEEDTSVPVPAVWDELRIMIMTQTPYNIIISYKGTARTLPYAEAHEQADIFLRGGWTLTDNGNGAFMFTDSSSDRTVTFTPVQVPLADWERELLATMDTLNVVTTSRAELDSMRRYQESVNDDDEVSGEKGYDVNAAEATAYDSLRLDY